MKVGVNAGAGRALVVLGTRGKGVPGEDLVWAVA